MVLVLRARPEGEGFRKIAAAGVSAQSVRMRGQTVPERGKRGKPAF
jgi:hypothetical protein